MSNYQNIAKAKAIEKQNRERLLKVNPKLNDRSGIYFLLREDENGFRFHFHGARDISRSVHSILDLPLVTALYSAFQ